MSTTVVPPPGGVGSPAPPAAAWHALPAADVLARLGVDADGLAEAEAAVRASRFGPNTLHIAAPVSAWRILVAQLRSVVVLLLVAAAALSWATGDAAEAAAIAAVLVLNTALGFGTELRARRAMEALRGLDVPTATVVRGGRQLRVDAAGVVPGDVLVLEAGSLVPADARLLRSAELRTAEAALTGESLPVDKDADARPDPDAPLAERATMVYKGTAVAAGAARAVVVATGMGTEVGRVGEMVAGIREEPTPLERRLDELGRRLVWVTLAVAAVVAGLGLLRGGSAAETVRIAIALAIAAVPEGLPAVATIALAVGVRRMARRRALVRRLATVESLGSVTVICTDKTGTLTGGEMTVTVVQAGDRELEVTGAGYAPVGELRWAGAPVEVREDPVLELALRVGALANRAELVRDGVRWSVRGDPTEAALLAVARKGGVDLDALRREWPETGELPFSSERMLMATFHRGPEGPVACVKGAPGRVIALCTRVRTARGDAPLGEAARRGLLARNDELAARGLRVLALAVGEAPRAGEVALRDLAFVALVGMTDPPAPGVQETIARFRDAGIRTVMITGDQRRTAEAIARGLGLLVPGAAVLEGRELEAIPDARLAARLERVAVLSRVAPEHKLRVVRALQERGDVVAMLGDGVNDAAALKKADVGVAMGGRGTGVAKEAASIVLQDDRFATIGAAVEEGRIVYDNVRKFVFYLFSCNLGEVLVLFVAGLAGLPSPLQPLQLLWLNLVTDTFPALALALEPGEEDVMRRPPRDPRAAILSPPFVRSVAMYAGLIAAVTLAAFAWALAGPGSTPERAGTVACITLALAQVFHLGNARSLDPVLAPRRALANRWALGSVVLVLALQGAAVYYAPLAGLLGMTSLPLRDWMVMVPLALVPAVVGQGLKTFRQVRRR
ncbi:MAG: HAD-IC family P-type ATPase [Longimicrobiaceae bacterium]